ncbi:GLPGLI family protein [Chryseobacterium sp. c4a]|uniref:GLPGLI family protein n=1 Tax=Chryseobacterium sp. c4a TaxID=1573582 RepID=UPI001358ACED|nr:GLPGLI family protein [Chryseobacterium sp. c4a]
MRALFLFFILLLSGLFQSQSKQFLYEYRFIPDSTEKKQSITEIMVLDIDKKRSLFFGQERYRSDSTLVSNAQKGIISMPTEGGSMIEDKVIKYPNSSQIEYVKVISYGKYIISQEVKLPWKLSSEFKTILNHKVQKATVSYGGRQWTAWFAKDIPFQDGPYKFYGLPGLILELEDHGKNHQYMLKGIKDTKEEFIYPTVNNYKISKISYPQFIKLYKNYRTNPVADLIGKIPDYQDTEGNTVSGQQKVREIEKDRLDEIKKDNNIIEIDLLKK